MREIRQSGSVRGVRRNPYPYRDYCLFGQAHELIAQRWQVQLLGILQDRGLLHRLGGAH
jgi:hypothetical protein